MSISTEKLPDYWRSWREADKKALLERLKVEVEKRQLTAGIVSHPLTRHGHIQALIDSLWPKQRLAFDSPARQLLLGGAAGPGKSHFLRVAAIVWAATIPQLQIYLFRRTFPDLHRNHMEGPNSFPVLLAPFLTDKLVKINYSKNEISFANGSNIRLSHMQNEKDKYSFQGAEIHVALFDELTHFTKSQYAYIRGRVRMVGVTVPPQYVGQFPRIVCGTNPGNIGHNWVKSLFIDSAPPGDIWTASKEEGGLTTQFIPAFLSDNPSMMQDDPDYALRLEGLGDPVLVKAMLQGDWNIVAGGIIDDLWNERRHVIQPFAIPSSWRIRRAFDWGSSRPFSVGWWAESDGTQAPNGVTYAPGSKFRIAEWYGWNGRDPDVGVKMLAVEVAKGIREHEEKLQAMHHVRIEKGPCDPAIFAAENGVCIADDMRRAGVQWEPADNSPGSRQTGLERLRKYLRASTIWPMEAPGLFIFDTCRQWLRTVPTLGRDEKKPDDADTKAEDHIYDETRYELMGIRRVAKQGKLLGL